ncbi:uncharacterized protein LOC111827241 isoform X2 [Myotis lucifugus]|uniref:uncharacterized protein LOC111827241 isoform X2 n=1 Tax=Myotis lucifugus TaxID=59463 RepID=UPI000CCC8AFF|nr:uncharacterized protein LOC111827241 isoform X2 [Myotis lucifugus]
MAAQRDRGTPAQPILSCAALSPNKPIPCKDPEEGAAGSPPLPCLWPPCGSPVGRAAWPPEAAGAEAGTGRGGDGAAAPPCGPAWEEEPGARHLQARSGSGAEAGESKVMMTAVTRTRQDPQLCLQVSLEMTESSKSWGRYLQYTWSVTSQNYFPCRHPGPSQHHLSPASPLPLTGRRPHSSMQRVPSCPAMLRTLQGRLFSLSESPAP